ncbi:response regulator [Piscinibacter gummiphilus]|uniref:Uncharacterized protein n=1 Tax=Piscinibacter gummiphilus TaxID=946333 RepID=A0A1W6LE49_9BURK|nr:response regulator [Piscinibacter gummiphilus]ARN22520.1 hypothetical protein A4W93_22855 [Piscinibacter gummiphilus]ATU67215.1 response regulator [Piscinibacter gummiphilus]GLS98107.1 hypothetical protein GCM10007918_53990 [Piscinibacter gummiphilus]
MEKEEVRVVIVEDDDDIRELLTTLIELDGYLVRSVPDGETALALVSEFRPACVLVDLTLPGIDGAEVTRQLRAEIGTELVIIAVTGSPSTSEHERLELAGVDFVLAKPLAENELRRFLPPL